MRKKLIFRLAFCTVIGLITIYISYFIGSSIVAKSHIGTVTVDGNIDKSAKIFFVKNGELICRVKNYYYLIGFITAQDYQGPYIYLVDRSYITEFFNNLYAFDLPYEMFAPGGIVTEKWIPQIKYDKTLDRMEFYGFKGEHITISSKYYQ